MFNVHDDLKSLTVEELKHVSDQDRLNFSICLMNLEHDLNIGNCIRSAHILGANQVFIFGKRKYDSRSTVGAHNYIDVIKIHPEDMEDRDCVSKTFDDMVRQYDLFPMMIDKTETSLPISHPNFSSLAKYHFNVYHHNPCLVFGNEGAGIPEYLFKGFPTFHIEQKGVIRSLNVSSAAAIVMYEFTRNMHD